MEIFDFEDRLHEVEMNEGDIVYYESARCLHGRMRPLDGAFYVNLFAHYRPIGDRAWFMKSNPDGTPTPVGDLGNCSVTVIAANDDDDAATDVGVGVDGSRVVDPGRIGVGSGDLNKQVMCSKADSWGVTTPYLSPSLLQLSGGKDLFKMWYDITVSINSINDGDGSDGGNSSSTVETRSVRDEL